MDQHVGFSEGKIMKGKNNEKTKAETKKADLLDWLLAIDASMP
jgi:hypothetical protein